MRPLAPLLVVATVTLLGSGVAMGLLHGHGLEIARRIHGPASVIWLALLGLHVIVYLGTSRKKHRPDALPGKREPIPGMTVRAYEVATVAICGLLLGAATVPAQHRWVDLLRDHHDEERAEAPSSAPLRRSHHRPHVLAGDRGSKESVTRARLAGGPDALAAHWESS
jgi:hypothetical protein